MGKFAKTQALVWKLGWKVKMKVTGSQPKIFGAEQISWNRGISINNLCAAYKRRAPQREIFVCFLQDIIKNVFQLRT